LIGFILFIERFKELVHVLLLLPVLPIVNNRKKPLEKGPGSPSQNWQNALHIPLLAVKT
jgi:hypothetical protein